MNPSPDDLLFGRLALHYKLITESQLEEVSGLLALAGGRRQLREILTEMGYLTSRQVEQLVAVQRDYLAKKAQRGHEAAPAVAPEPLPVSKTQAGPHSVRSGTTTLPAIGANAGVTLAAIAPLSVAPAHSFEAPPPLAPQSVVGGHGLEGSWRSADRKLDALLAYAVALRASDVHIHSGVPIAFRLSGSLRPVDREALDPAFAEELLSSLLDEEKSAALRTRGQIDFPYTLAGKARFRVNIFRQQRGLDAVLRVIPLEPPTLADLGLMSSLTKLTDFHQGLVLVTGPAGCGKSSTLAALIRILNESRRDHIITIEDPIEYVHTSRSCVVNQRQVGSHTGSFARALRAALREDPDIIAIGELRDLESISLAISAAETGHLVLSTLHTNNTIRTVNRILGVFPPNLQEQIRTMLAESLRAVISQRLLVRADESGRVPALEILYANKAVANLIRENKTFQIRSVLQTGASHGMMQLDNSLADLVKRRIVTREEALRHAEDPSKIPN
jgi:twitching motility protein PilT